MQELEKILEEIEAEFDRRIDIQLKIMAGLGDDVYRYGYGKSLEAYQQGKLFVEDIIRKHMNDGWISVDERLPMRTLDEKINESYQKYLVFIDGVDGWDIDIAVYDFWNDKKWREAHDGYGEIENVNAWRPLPEPYRPERSDNHDGE